MRKLVVSLALLVSYQGLAQPRPAELYRFEVELGQQMCTGHDGERSDFVCTGDTNKALVEVALERVKPSEIEDRAFEGTSEEMGLSLNSTVQYLPRVTVRRSIIGKTSMYTLRFKSSRNDADAKTFETVYIEEGEELGLNRPVVLMADRFGNGVRFFRQVYFNLTKIP